MQVSFWRVFGLLDPVKTLCYYFFKLAPLTYIIIEGKGIGSTFMITTQNLSYAYPAARESEVLHNINFGLKRGEYCHLFGEDDAGKTTLLHVILHFLTGYTGNCFTEFSSVRYVPDGIYIERKRKVKEYLGWQRRYGKEYNIEMQEALLEIFGIDWDAELLEMTYEQNKLVAVIGAMAAMPDLFVADEMANYLSKGALEKVSKALKLLNDRGTTVLLTGEHYADYAEYASSFSYMSKGKIVEKGKVPGKRRGNRVVSLAGFEGILPEKAGFHFLWNRREVQYYLYQGEMKQLCQALSGISCSGMTVEETTWEEEFWEDYTRWK